MERLTVKSIMGRWALKAPRQEAVGRLAAYEDTGMEPEEIKEVQEAMKPIPFGRFREVMEAERDGRCKVDPCKVGDTVYVIRGGAILNAIFKGTQSYNGNSMYIEIQNVHQCGITLDQNTGDIKTNTWTSGVLEQIDVSYIGKTVFLTHEAAEAALKAGDHR